MDESITQIIISSPFSERLDPVATVVHNLPSQSSESCVSIQTILLNQFSIYLKGQGSGKSKICLINVLARHCNSSFKPKFLKY